MKAIPVSKHIYDKCDSLLFIASSFAAEARNGIQYFNSTNYQSFKIYPSDRNSHLCSIRSISWSPLRQTLFEMNNLSRAVLCRGSAMFRKIFMIKSIMFFLSFFFFLKVYSLHCTLRYFVLMSSLCILFLSQVPIHLKLNFNSQLLCELNHKVHLSKVVSEIFHFRFGFVFKVYIFVQQKAQTFAFSKHNSFQNKNNRKARHSFAPRPLIFKVEVELPKKCLGNEVLSTSLFLNKNF